MNLVTKFNLLLVGVFTLALVPAGLLTNGLLQESARRQVVENARIMMETALAVRGYTASEVQPLLADAIEETFLPQSVPAYSASRVFASLRNGNPDYVYKEATLNPTNPADRTTDWEADVVNAFRNEPTRKEIVGERETTQGRTLFLAHPMVVNDASCLICHSTPDQAPASMVKLYGPANGFGWKLGEIVGAQIISVPMSLPTRMAQQALQALVLSLVGVFLFTLVVLNILLRIAVIRPLRRLTVMADQVSTGDLNAPEVDLPGRDEVAQLAASFGRMRISLKTAIGMLEEG